MGRSERLLEKLDYVDKEKIGQSFRNSREERGMSQQEMADRAGYSLTQYNKLENGERMATTEDVVKVGMALLDYEDSLLPMYKRRWRFIDSEISKRFEDVEEILETAIDGMDQVFDQISLRKMVTGVLMLISIYLCWPGITAYQAGAFLGRIFRGLYDILPGFLQ